MREKELLLLVVSAVGLLMFLTGFVLVYSG